MNAFDSNNSHPPRPLPEAVDPFVLGNADADALDALVAAGYDVNKVVEEQRARAEYVARVLGLLDSTSVDSTKGVSADTLVTATLGRIAREGQGPGQDQGSGLRLTGAKETPYEIVEDATLIPADEDALEALIGAGYITSKVTHSLRARAQRQLALFSMLCESPTPTINTDAQREALVARTMARVEAAASNPDAYSFARAAEARRSFRSRFRLSDVASAAAMLLVGSAVVVPMLGSLRDKARQAACMNNFSAVGNAFAQYANDGRSALPMATASLAGTPWWNVGKPGQSNSANYHLLADEGHQYVKLDRLACPANPKASSACEASGKDWASIDEVSYSYQNLFTSHRPRWGQSATMVVLVDRSPVVEKAIRGQGMNPMENSTNHGGAGQNMLRMDGSVVWTTSPIAPGTDDNVWLPRPIERLVQYMSGEAVPQQLRGTEEPAWLDDIFVGP